LHYCVGFDIINMYIHMDIEFGIVWKDDWFSLHENDCIKSLGIIYQT